MLPAQVSYWQLQETKQHNRNMEAIDAYNALQNARNATTNERNAQTNAYNAKINAWNASINERKLPIEQQKADAASTQAAAASSQAETASKQYELAVEKWDYMKNPEYETELSERRKNDAQAEYYQAQKRKLSGPDTERTEAEIGYIGAETEYYQQHTEKEKQDTQYREKQNKSYWVDELVDWWNKGTQGYSNWEKGDYYSSKSKSTEKTSPDDNKFWFFDAMDDLLK